MENVNGIEEENSNNGYSWIGRVAYLEKEIFRLDNELNSLKEKCREGFLSLK